MTDVLETIVGRLKQSSPVAIALYAVSLFGFLLSTVASSSLLNSLALNFATFGGHIWTLATFWIVETNIIVLFGNVLCIHLGGTVLEPLWRRWELGRLALVANGATVVSAFIIYYALAVFVGFGTLDYDTLDVRLCGLSAFNAAVFVGVKQILPDSVLLTTSIGRLKNNNIPLCMFLGSTILSLFGAIRCTVPFQYAIGSYSAWIYLRFFQSHESGIRGDADDHFAFHTFFPTRMHRPLARVGRISLTLATRLGLCRPTIRRFVDVQQLHAHGGQLLDAGGNADAERRRAKAMRELTERMERSKAQARQQTEAWPSMDDEVVSPSSSSPIPTSTTTTTAVSEKTLVDVGETTVDKESV